MQCTSRLRAVLERVTRNPVVPIILFRPRAVRPAVTFMVTFELLPISRPGTVVGSMAGLPSPPLQPGAKLMALLLTLVPTLRVVGLSSVLAQWEVVGLLLSELKPLRLLISGRCTVNGRVKCITVLQTVELLRGRSPFTILFIMWVDPTHGWLGARPTLFTRQMTWCRIGPKLLCVLGSVCVQTIEHVHLRKDPSTLLPSGALMTRLPIACGLQARVDGPWRDVTKSFPECFYTSGRV